MRFNAEPETHDVQPYSEIYGRHPRTLVFTGPAMGNLDDPHLFSMPAFKIVSEHANPFTGKLEEIMAKRHSALVRPRDYRLPILNNILLDGPAWEPSSYERLNMFCTAVAKKQAETNEIGSKESETYRKAAV